MKNNKLLIPSIGKQIIEAEINEVKSLVDSIKEKEIELTLLELKMILIKDLNIQILTNEDIDDLITPIKKYIKEENVRTVENFT